MELPRGDRMTKTPEHDQRGFTLLEILVVIAILGLLIGLVAPAALRQLGFARQSVAKQSIERIGSVLDMYKLDVGTYPDSDQGLRARLQTRRHTGPPRNAPRPWARTRR